MRKSCNLNSTVFDKACAVCFFDFDFPIEKAERDKPQTKQKKHLQFMDITVTIKQRTDRRGHNRTVPLCYGRPKMVQIKVGLLLEI